VVISLIVCSASPGRFAPSNGPCGGLAGGDDGAAVPGVARGDEIGEMARAVQVFKTAFRKRARLAAEQLARKRPGTGGHGHSNR